MVSNPSPPAKLSAPASPSKKLSLVLPISVSAKRVPRMFSMELMVSVLPQGSSTVVRVRLTVIPLVIVRSALAAAYDNVSLPLPPLMMSAPLPGSMVSLPSLPLMVSLPSPPVSTLAPPSPTSVSAKSVPTTFSMFSSVSMVPKPSVPLPACRSTVTELVPP